MAFSAEVSPARLAGEEGVERERVTRAMPSVTPLAVLSRSRTQEVNAAIMNAAIIKVMLLNLFIELEFTFLLSSILCFMLLVDCLFYFRVQI